MWDPQWEALTARHRVVRYDLRGFGRRGRVETRVLEPGRPRRRDGRRGPRARGAGRVLAGGLDRARHGARVPGPGRGARLGVRRSRRPRASRRRPRSWPPRAGGGALRRRRTGQAMAAFDVGVWVDGLGQPDGTGPAAVRDLVRRMTYETYVQEKPYGDTILLDPPAAGRLAEIARAGARDRRPARHRRRRAASAGAASPPGSPARAGSTCRTSPTCPTSSGPSGSPRRCSRSSPRSTRADAGPNTLSAPRPEVSVGPLHCDASVPGCSTESAERGGEALRTTATPPTGLDGVPLALRVLWLCSWPH